MTWTVLGFALVIAFSFQGYSIWRISALVGSLKGAIRTREDLQAVKGVINTNMQMAIAYIVFWFLLIGALVWIVMTAILSFTQAVTIFFLFGVITLPFGLIGRSFEKKIHALRVESGDSKMEEVFRRWLKEWKEPRFQLSDGKGAERDEATR